MQILIGTNNPNKFQEFKDIFSAYAPKIELFRPIDLKIEGDPAEDCDSLEGNAIKKAKFFGSKSGAITVADDTGLFVDALNGEPGMNSKRWHLGTDYERCVKLLERLADLPKEKLTARYIGVVALYNPLTKEIWARLAKVEGLLTREFGKEGGFGYDRIFKVISINKHYSELTKEELIQIGHRGQLIKELISNTNFLKQ